MKKLSLLAASVALVLVGCGGGGSSSSSGSANTGNSGTTVPVNFDAEYAAKLGEVEVTKLGTIPAFDVANECKTSDIAFETSHFIVGRKSNDVSESELLEFTKVIESSYRDVLNELSITSSELPSRDKKYQSCVRVTGDSGGNAIYGGFNLDLVDGQTAKELYRMAMHELTHMVQIEISDEADSERWFNEGLAYIVGQKEFALVDDLNTFISSSCFNIAPSELTSYYQAYPEKNTPPGQARADECLITEYPTYAVQFQYLSEKYGMTKEKVVDLFTLQRESNLDFAVAYDQMMADMGHSVKISDLDKSFVTSVLVPWLQSQFVSGDVKSDVTVSELFVATNDYYYGDIDTVSVNSSTGQYSAYLKQNRDGLYKAYFMATDDKMYGPVSVEMVNGQFKNATLDLRGATECKITDPNCAD